jgi:hypothetical protein
LSNTSFRAEFLKDTTRNELISVLLIVLSELVPLIPSWGQNILKPIISAVVFESEQLLDFSPVIDKAKEIRKEIMKPIDELRFVVEVIVPEIDQEIDVEMGIDFLVKLPSLKMCVPVISQTVSVESISSFISAFFPVLSPFQQSFVQAILNRFYSPPSDRVITKLSAEISNSLGRLRTQATIHTTPLSHFSFIICSLWNGRKIAEPSQPDRVSPFPPENLKYLTRKELINVLLIVLSGLVPLIPSCDTKILKLVIFDALLKLEVLLDSSPVVVMAKEIWREITKLIGKLRDVVEDIAPTVHLKVDALMRIDFLVKLPAIRSSGDYCEIPHRRSPDEEEEEIPGNAEEGRSDEEEEIDEWT